MHRRRRRDKRVQTNPYYPSEQRGHQMLMLDDHTIIGTPRRS